MTRMNTMGVLIMASALVAAACANEPEPPSSEEFTARATGICDEAGEQIGALGLIPSEQINRVEEAGTYREIADYWEGMSNAEIEALDQLMELTPPPEYAEIVAEYLSAAYDMTDFISGYVVALRAEHLTGFEYSVEEVHATEAKVANLALEAGLTRCGQTLRFP